MTQLIPANGQIANLKGTSIPATPTSMQETIAALLHEGTKLSIAHALNLATRNDAARQALSDFNERVSAQASLKDLAVAGLILLASGKENADSKLQTRFVAHARGRVADVLRTLATDGSASLEDFSKQLAVIKFTLGEILPEHSDHLVGRAFLGGLADVSSSLTANGLHEHAAAIRLTFPRPDFTARWNGLGGLAGEKVIQPK